MKDSTFIKKRCVTSINRKYGNSKELHELAKKRNDIIYTKIYETNNDQIVGLGFSFLEKELVILKCYLPNGKWTVITTHRIISNYDGKIKAINNKDIRGINDDVLYEDIKGVKQNNTAVIKIYNKKEIFLIEVDSFSALSIIHCIECLEQLFNRSSYSFDL